MKLWNRFGVLTLLATAAISVAGCSGGGSGPSATPTYTIGGTISGYTGSGLVLQDNGADNLTISTNATTFTFATQVTSGSVYSVTVLTQPAGFNCAVASGSGTASANVGNVAIACQQAYSIGGSVFGLTGTGLMLQDNGGNNLAVSATSKSYGFVFPGVVPTAGAPYSITVFTNPTGEACTVASPTGTAKASVYTANVSCTAVSTNSYSIGGTVKGLTGSGLVLQDQAGINNVDLLPVSTNGNFSFVDPILSGGSYSVTVLNQPLGRNCAVSSGTGTATATVSNVSVVCLGEWTWMNGSSTVGGNGGQAGVYGTQGTASATNVPGGRQQAASWIDSSGKTWLFGGYGADSTGVGFGGQLNDLWKFDPTLGATGEWTWMGGSNVEPASTSFGAAGAPGIYGTLGTPSFTNVPGGREQAASWIDSSGKMWLFGGEGIDVNGGTGQLNDLWKFDPTLGTTGEWTWMGGSSAVPFLFGGQFGVYGTQGTPSASNIPGGRYGAMTWKDAQGNFWMFGGSGSDVTGTQGYLNDLWKFTPSTGQWTWVGGSSIIQGNNGVSGVYGTLGTPDPSNVPGGRDAGVTWTDAQGNFWLFGGIGADADGNFAYENDLWKYTPSTGNWTWMGGSKTAPQPYSGQPGVYGALGTASATSAPGGRYSAVSWTDASGNLWMSGGAGYDSTGTQGYLNDLWEYTPSVTGGAGQWTWTGGGTMVGRGGGQSGVYGTLGVAGDNIPGGRFGATSWVDSSGSLWLFGGEGYDVIASQGNLNDLWRYQP